MTGSKHYAKVPAAASDIHGGFSLPRIATRVFGTPLLIQPDKLDTILSALRPRLLGVGGKAGAFDMQRDEPSNDSIIRVENGVAIIQVLGTLVAAPSGVLPMSGMTSYGQIGDAFMAAVDDTAIDAVLFEIDSPGGEANGVFDLADMILAVRGAKPVWSVANEMALSAAYAIASATDRIVLSRTASVGSVGVVAAHVDRSSADKDAGLKFSFIFAGDRKIDGNPHERLSKRARDDIQEKVDTIFDIFAAGVARGRGLTVEDVAATEAAIFMGEDAVTAGFADTVGTVGNVLEALGSRASGGLRFPPGTMSQTTNADGTMSQRAIGARIVTRAFDNFFTITDGSAKDRGRSGPDTTKIDDSVFAIIRETRSGGSSRNTATVLRSTSRAEAERKARAIAARKKDTSLVVILGQLWGRDDDKTEVFRDRIGFVWKDDSAGAVNPKRGDSASPKSVKKEIPMTDEIKTEATVSDDAAESHDTAVTEAVAKTTLPPQATAKIVDIDKVRSEAHASTLADVTHVIDLCALAGVPEMAKGFIGKGLSIDQVRSTLLELRAEKSGREEVVSRHADNSSEAHASAADNYGWDRAFARAAGQRAI